MKAKVTGVTAWQGTPTGGTLSIRAPRYVDSSGNASPEEYSAVLDVTHTPPRWMDALDPTRELYVIVQGPDDLPGVRARFYEVLHYGPDKAVRTEFTRKLISSDLSGLIFDYAMPEPTDLPVGFGDAPLTMRAAQQVIEEGGAVVSEWTDIKVDIAQTELTVNAAAAEALSAAGINLAYISETTADPAAAPDGTRGAKRLADGSLQRLERVAGGWVARGSPLLTRAALPLYDAREAGLAGGTGADMSAALKTALTRSNREILLPPGEIILSTADSVGAYLTINGASNIRVRGQGTIIKAADGATARTLLVFEGCADVDLAGGLIIDGAQPTLTLAGAASTGVRFAKSSVRCRSTGNTFRNLNGTGINDQTTSIFSDGNYGGATDVKYGLTTITGNTFLNCRTTFNTIGGSRGGIYANNHHDGCWWGWKLDGQLPAGVTYSTLSGAWSVHDNVFTRCGTQGIANGQGAIFNVEENVSLVHIHHNLIDGCNGSDILSLTTGQTDKPVRLVRFEDNTILNHTNGIGGRLSATGTASMDGLTFDRNAWDTVGGAILSVITGVNVTLSRLSCLDNRVLDWGLQATGPSYRDAVNMTLAGTTQGMVLGRNEFTYRNPPASVPYAYNINNTGTCDEVVWHGDVFRGSALAQKYVFLKGLTIRGTGTTLTRNADSFLYGVAWRMPDLDASGSRWYLYNNTVNSVTTASDLTIRTGQSVAGGQTFAFRIDNASNLRLGNDFRAVGYSNATAHVFAPSGTWYGTLRGTTASGTATTVTHNFGHTAYQVLATPGANAAVWAAKTATAATINASVATTVDYIISAV